MSGPPVSLPEPVTEKRQLMEFIASGCKPPEMWRIGTEHEKFVYRADNLRPVPYEETGGRHSIRAFLEELQRFGWIPVFEQNNPIALTNETCAITLEPGGQLELSGQPLKNIHQTCDEITEHLRQVRVIADELGVHLMGLGYQPKWPIHDTPWIPKGRYKIMQSYMPKKGRHGLDMMLQTCTIQVNLDYASETDMVKKFRIGLALQPIATALFANSPFLEGKPSGFLSYRSYVWTDTDPDRCGMVPFVFEPDMGFERYVEYALDVPMYFVYRNSAYIDAAGQSFRDFLHRKLPALPGELPTLGDWSDHLTTLYPEVRMKRFLEMRGADGGPWQRICALPAFWVGLLYDSVALDEAYELVRYWSTEDLQQLRDEVPRSALKTPFKGRILKDVALEVLAISRRGLHRRAVLNTAGQNESIFLDTLFDIAQSNRTPAENLLEAYYTRWGENVEPVFSEYAY